MTDNYMPYEQESLKKEFLDESEVHIENLNKSLLIAEENVKNNRAVPDEIINEMFRAVHTIKGSASFLGFSKVHTLAHNMETLMDKVRKKEKILTTLETDVLFKGFDRLEKLLSLLVESKGEQLEINDYLEVLKNVIKGKEPAKVKAEPAPEKSAGQVKKEDKLKEAKPKIVKIDRTKYIGEFIDDTSLNTDRFNNILLELEKNRNNEELIQELFRIAHTIKGAAGTIGIIPVEEVVHRMESILDKVRNKELELNGTFFSCLFEAVDTVSEMIDEISKNPGNINNFDVSHAEQLKQKLEALLKGEVVPEPKEVKPEPVRRQAVYGLHALREEKEQVMQVISKNIGIFNIKLHLKDDLPLKDIKLLLIKEKLARIGILLKVIPDPENENMAEDDFIYPVLFLGSKTGENEIKNLIDFDGLESIVVDKVSKAEIDSYKKEFAGEVPKEQEAELLSAYKVEDQAKPKGEISDTAKKLGIGGATVRIDIGKLDNLMNLAGELVIIKAQLNQLVNNLNSKFQKKKGFDNKVENLFKNVEHTTKELKRYFSNAQLKFDKNQLELDKMFIQIDKIMGEEQVLSQALLTDKINSDITDIGETTSKLGKISSDIQNGVMETRMIPIEGVFTRFRRLVRDISKELGKDISLVIVGEETELDKKIIDDLGDPLTHMIRNAIDHGIEPKEERKKKGKPEKGNIILKAFHEGNRICIEISDDGRGLDKDRILEKAVVKDLISPEQVEDLTDREKLDFIFMPGFSTAKEITELSGRGVGLDVVRKMIENINGSVDIQSQLGQGTTFILKIPLTLAIIPALLVVIGGLTYAFPLESVVEIIKVKKDEIYSIDGNATVKLREHALSIVKLENVIGIKSNGNQAENSQKVVVITDSNEQIGVSVDILIGEEEIVIKSLSDHFANIIGISGASVLGDGRIALIIDTLSVIKEVKNTFSYE